MAVVNSLPLQYSAHPHSRSFPITSRGGAHNLYVRSAMLHVSWTWVPTWSDLHCLQGTKSARKISWRGCSLIIRQRYSSPVDSDGMAMWNIAMVGCRKTRNSLQWVVMAMVDLRKPVPKWSSWTDYCWTWDPKLPTGKIGLIHLEVLSDWTHPYRDYSTKVQ